MDIGQKFKAFTSKKYSDQTISFLNAYWDEVGHEAELFWDFTQQFFALDHEKGKEGCDLDEFNAHRFLEKYGETKTVKQMRDELREIDMDFNKRMAILEYLLWRNHKTVSDFVNRPQGGVDPDELLEAQRLLDEVKRSQEESQIAADLAKQRENEAVSASNEARSREEAARESEAPFKRAQEELNLAIAELQAQEEDYRRKSTELKSKSEDQNVGVVTRNKAANELSQLLATDPLPLRQAKISLEAAERKAERTRKPFKEALEYAEEARHEADRTADESMGAREAADAAVDECNRKFEEAEAYLRSVMSQPTAPHG